MGNLVGGITKRVEQLELRAIVLGNSCEVVVEGELQKLESAKTTSCGRLTRTKISPKRVVCLSPS